MVSLSNKLLCDHVYTVGSPNFFLIFPFCKAVWCETLLRNHHKKVSASLERMVSLSTVLLRFVGDWKGIKVVRNNQEFCTHLSTWCQDSMRLICTIHHWRSKLGDFLNPVIIFFCAVMHIWVLWQCFHSTNLIPCPKRLYCDTTWGILLWHDPHPTHPP